MGTCLFSDRNLSCRHNSHNPSTPPLPYHEGRTFGFSRVFAWWVVDHVCFLILDHHQGGSAYRGPEFEAGVSKGEDAKGEDAKGEDARGEGVLPTTPLPPSTQHKASSSKEDCAELKATYVSTFRKNTADEFGGLNGDDLLPLLINNVRRQKFGTSNSMVVLDIGGNIGTVSVSMASSMVQVWNKILMNDVEPGAKHSLGVHGTAPPSKDILVAFEPLPTNFEILEKLFKHARLADSLDARAENLAVADKSGEVYFTKADYPGDQQQAILPAKTSTSVTVQAVTLEEYVKEKNFEHIDLIKCDVEGFDPLVIKGSLGILDRVDLFVFEYNSKWRSTGGVLKTIVGLFDQHGLDCFFIGERNLIPLTGNFWDDAYEFYTWSNVLAISRSSPYTNFPKSYSMDVTHADCTE